jgi:hypothetical protein
VGGLAAADAVTDWNARAGRSGGPQRESAPNGVFGSAFDRHEQLRASFSRPLVSSRSALADVERKGPVRAMRPTRQFAVLRLLVLMVGSLAASTAAAQVLPTEVEWIRQFGGVGQGSERLDAVAVHDGVYVAGSGSALAGSAVPFSPFVRKYDASGVELWTRPFGEGSTTVTGIAVSDSGVYVTGTARSALDGQIFLGDFDGYIKKFSLAGDELWTRQFGTPVFDFAAAIAADAFGVYVVGHTIGTLPSQLHTGRFYDAFVMKYDVDGEELWTRQFGTPDTTNARGIVVDGVAVYVVGQARGALPGQTARGDTDAFVRRFDPSGNEVWTRQFGTSSFDTASAAAVNASGIAILGTTQGAFAGQVTAGGFDTFVRVFESSGAEKWTRQFGTASSDFARGIAADSAAFYVVGETSGQFPGQVRHGWQDVFLRKYDLAGSERWTRQIGGAFHNAAGGVAVDTTGVYFGGSFEIPHVHFPEASLEDGVVAKYDASGGGLWERRIESTAQMTDVGQAVAVHDGGVYVGGWVALPLPGQQAAGGSSDAYVRKYDVAGNEIWTRQFGTGSNDEVTGIAVDASGVYLAGLTFGTLPGQTRGDGGMKAFVRKYDHDGNEQWTRQYGFSDFLDETDATIAISDTGVYVASNTTAYPDDRTEMVNVRKYDLDGGELWTRQFITSSRDKVRGIAADATGVYLAGATTGVFPGQQASGNLDAFVRKYSADGSELWTRQFGTDRVEFAFGVAVHESAVYVTGWTSGAFPGESSQLIADGFVRKLDADGTHIWTRQFGTSLITMGFAISADASGVYVAGDTETAFGPNGFPDSNTRDTFVRKYSEDGAVLWTTAFGTAGFSDTLTAIAVDRGGIFVAGTTAGTFPGFSQGFTDPFVVKLMNPVSIATDSQVNLKRRQVPVSIFSTADFDATSIEPDSVCFGTTEPGGRNCRESHGRGHTQDVNGDGRPDMLLHFLLDESNIAADTTEVCVAGHTRSSVPFKGCRAIQIK